MTRVREAATALEPSDLVAVIAFAEHPSVALPLGPASLLSSPASLPPSLRAEEGSDVEGAIRAGLDLLGERSRGSDLVLVSDGRETRGDARSAAREAAARGAKLHAVIVEPAGLARAEPGVIGLDGPSVARQGAAVALRATVASAARRPTRLRLTLRRAPSSSDGRSGTDGGDPYVLGSADVSLAARDHRVVPFVTSITRTGFQVLEVTGREVRDGPLPLVPARATHGILVEGPSRALILEPTFGSVPMTVPGRFDPVRLSLEAAGFEVEASRAGVSRSELADVDVVVLCAFPRSQMSAETERAISEFVTEGGGLLALGGRDAFGPGGYRGSKIERILPVDCGPEDPGLLKLVVLLDASGSMAGAGKPELVAEAVEASLSALGSHDLVAAARFSGEPTWLVPTFRPRDSAAADLRESVLRFAPSGDTDLARAVESAVARFDESGGGPGERRHLLVVSDGRAEGDFEGLGLKLAERAVRVSVIATGDDVDERSLRALTRHGANGSFDRFTIGDRRGITLGDLVTRDLAGGDVEQSTSAVVARDPAPWLSQPDPGFAPVQGWVRTHAKPGASVALALVTGDPLLASWRSGRGTAVAFTSDPTGDWAPAYAAPAPLLGEAARHAAREALPASDFWFRSTDGRDGSLEVELVAGSDSERVEPELLVGSVAGLEGRLELEPRGPGLWRSPSPAWPPGSYLVRIFDAALGRERFRVPYDVPESLERIDGPADRELLEEISALTGGGAGDAGPTTPPPGTNLGGAGLARTLILAAALALLVLDILLGRPGLSVKDRA